jgi:THO complex subunit 2
VLLQFHDFIVSNLDLSSFEKLFPPFEKIVKDYGIEPPVAFYLWRPILAEKIRQYDVDLSIQMQKRKLLRGLASTEKSGDAHPDTPNSSSSVGETGMQDVSQDFPSTKDGTISHAEAQDGDIATPNSEE